jgi:hypothetical protein
LSDPLDPPELEPPLELPPEPLDDEEDVDDDEVDDVEPPFAPLLGPHPSLLGSTVAGGLEHAEA